MWNGGTKGVGNMFKPKYTVTLSILKKSLVL